MLRGCNARSQGINTMRTTQRQRNASCWKHEEAQRERCWWRQNEQTQPPAERTTILEEGARRYKQTTGGTNTKCTATQQGREHKVEDSKVVTLSQALRHPMQIINSLCFPRTSQIKAPHRAKEEGPSKRGTKDEVTVPGNSAGRTSESPGSPRIHRKGLRVV